MGKEAAAAENQPDMEGRLFRLLFSVPSGRDFKYSVSFRWAMPTPLMPPSLARSTPSCLETVAPSESW